MAILFKPKKIFFFLFILASLREGKAASPLEKPCQKAPVLLSQSEDELLHLEQGWETAESSTSIVVEIDDPIDLTRLPGESGLIETLVLPRPLGERKGQSELVQAGGTVVMPNRPALPLLPEKKGPKIHTFPGSLYEIIESNGNVVRIAISDQHLQELEIDPVLALKNAAAKRGRDVEVKPFLSKVPVFDEKGMIIAEKEEQVSGGVRSIFYDPKTSAFYKYSLSTDPQFNLSMRVREKIITRYFNKAYKNSGEEFGIEIQALQHLYIHGDLGWSSQVKNEGMSLFQYRQSLKGAELDDFNNQLVLLKRNLSAKTKAVAQMIEERFNGAHLYKGISDQSFDFVQKWLFKKNHNDLIQEISQALHLKADRSQIIKLFSGAEVLKLRKMMAQFEKLPIHFRLNMRELEEVEAELEMYKTFKDGHKEKIDLLTAKKNQLQNKIGKHRSLSEYQHIKGEIDLFLSPKISPAEINKQFSTWALEHGYLADIDTGRIHTDTPHGKPNDLGNCKVRGFKMVKGKKIVIIRCHDIG